MKYIDLVINSMENEKSKDEIKKVIHEGQTSECMLIFHHDLGLFLRNNWGLWKGDYYPLNPTIAYFINLGIFHPHDMSAFVLRAYWEYYHGTFDEDIIVNEYQIREIIE
jgi:hypothetical protein